MPNCDVNGDSACNSVDALFIIQCDAGIANPLCPVSSQAQSLFLNLDLSQASTVQIQAADVLPGEDVTIHATANVGTDDLGAAAVELHYDPTVLQPLTCKADPDALFDFKLCNISYEQDGTPPDAIRFNMLSSAGVSGEVKLADITFHAIGNAGDKSVLSADVSTFADIHGSTLAVDVMPGSVNVVARKLFLPLISP
ncbi:MAG: hypothetical protein GXP38_09960 [Chloroflexi bacterium]|nr:hypothetical protein [Chloroflexota bacterium]